MSTDPMHAIDNDALIESSFRRMLGAIESERDKIRSTWQQLEQERESVTQELDEFKQMTQEWCEKERLKQQAERERLDDITVKMNEIWPQVMEVIEINCSGQLFVVPRSTLCSIEKSQLGKMFSDRNIGTLPRDSEGRFYFDFNPDCFGFIVEYLQNRRLKVDCPTPIIPMELQHSMELLADKLKIFPFMRQNKISPVHATSLHVVDNTVQATHPGWQVINAQHPLSLAGPSYFEVKIVSNPNVHGGLAVGVCGHIPQGTEVHSIRLMGSVLYNSGNSLISDVTESQDLPKGIQFEDNCTFGVKYDVNERALHWYYNQDHIGTSHFKKDCYEKMTKLYPIFALYVPGQMIEVTFYPGLPPFEKEEKKRTSKRASGK